MSVSARGYEAYQPVPYLCILLVNARMLEIFGELDGIAHRCAPWRNRRQRERLLARFLAIVFASKSLLGALVKGAIAMAEGNAKAMVIWV